MKQSSSSRVDLWLQSWFPKSSFISNFLHFQIRPHWKMFHDSEHCFYFLNASLLLFFWQKLWWHLAENCVTNSLERNEPPPPNFFEAHFWIGLKSDPSCKLYKKHITLEILAVVDPLPCWKTLMDHCVSLNTPSR